MKLEQFRELVERLQEDNDNLRDYFNNLNNVDSSMPAFLLENYPYNVSQNLIHFILNEYLGEYVFNYVKWFIYDKELYLDNVVLFEGNIYEIDDIEDFMNFMKENFKWD
jgi:hypothetical protein